MKTIGRILIILAVTGLIAAGLYFLVNANASSMTSSGFPGGEGFRPDGGLPSFEGGSPPEGGFAPFEGEHREGREREGMGGGWAFGLIKNVGIIAILVAIIVLPKKLFKPKKPVQPSSGTV